MAQKKQIDYKCRWEAACVTIVELQQKLKREQGRRRTAQLKATRDELTRLYNRRSFNTEGRSKFSRSKRGANSVAMFFIDANGFKTVNDTLGHAVGDALLVAIARTIKRGTRPSDLAGRGVERNIVSRNGGDEFVLFFETLDEAGARIIASRIHKAVQAIRLRRSPNLRASVSIGVVVGVPPADLEWTNLIAQADAAMYEAKAHRGTNRSTICVRLIGTLS